MTSSRGSVERHEGEQEKDDRTSGDLSQHKDNLAALTDPTQKQAIERNPMLRYLQKIAEYLARYNIEGIGIAPIQVSQRNSNQWWSPGLLWFSANVNGKEAAFVRYFCTQFLAVLTFSGGTLAPALGLGMAASQVTIFLFSALLSLPAAYFSTFGPQLGMRQMVQSRYSWGYFPACIACLLNAVGMIGFMILNNILGGQTLSAVSSGGSLSPSVGIVIIAVISLGVSFSGIKVL